MKEAYCRNSFDLLFFFFPLIFDVLQRLCLSEMLMRLAKRKLRLQLQESK